MAAKWDKKTQKENKIEFFHKNIWSIQKKAVPLHPLFEKGRT